MPEIKPDVIKFTIEEGIGHLVLNNPPSNMMNKQWSLRMQELLKDIDTVALKGIIVYGSNRHFSAGVELDFAKQASIDALNHTDSKHPISMSEDCKSFKKILEFKKPVIAAIRGVCVGSGFELALACHWRICDEKAVMGLVESSFNLIPGCGGTVRLPEITGTGRAMEMIIEGATINSEKALKLKIVNQVVHHKQLITVAREYIERLSPYYKVRYNENC
ncbi:MAG: enoyl-CoA hydratase/isomerase family protein [Candidatus Brocadiaceae bacterium]|nr:enoyl-CoA hydratase/isomerase family protein [Candidatus Brocadiaceae bacterium]